MPPTVRPDYGKDGCPLLRTGSGHSSRTGANHVARSVIVVSRVARQASCLKPDEGVGGSETASLGQRAKVPFDMTTGLYVPLCLAPANGRRTCREGTDTCLGIGLILRAFVLGGRLCCSGRRAARTDRPGVETEAPSSSRRGSRRDCRHFGHRVRDHVGESCVSRNRRCPGSP